jgi:hypothetical protein
MIVQDFATAPRTPYRVHVVSAPRRKPPFDGHVDIRMPDEFVGDDHSFKAEMMCLVIRELSKQGVPECWNPDDWRIRGYERQASITSAVS